MKLILLADFDLGVSFGIDDTTMELNNISLPAKYNDISTYSPKETYSPEIDLQIGYGIRFDLLRSVALQYWKDDINNSALKDDSLKNYKLLIKNSKITKMYLDVFSLGSAILRIDLSDIDSNQKFLNIDLLSCIDGFEYKSFPNYIKSLISDYLGTLQDNLNIKELSYRFNIEDVEDDELLSPILLVITDTDERQEEIRTLFLDEYEQQSEYVETSVNIGKFFFGWVSMVLEKTDDEMDEEEVEIEIERCILNLQIMFIYQSINKSFELLLSRHLKKSVINNFTETNSSYSSKTLNKLRTLILTVVQLTDIINTSINIVDMEMYEAHDKFFKLDKRHQNLIDSCEIFVNIQSELNRNEEEKQNNRLNSIIFLLSSLTFISVISDIISNVDFLNTILPDPLLRFSIIAVIPSIAIFLTWKWWKKK
jgi:hypothetical protein